MRPLIGERGQGKYYAVLQGRQPGIYTSWDKCKEQVDRFSRARFKSFGSVQEAKEFMEVTRK